MSQWDEAAQAAREAFLEELHATGFAVCSSSKAEGEIDFNGRPVPVEILIPDGFPTGRRGCGRSTDLEGFPGMRNVTGPCACGPGANPVPCPGGLSVRSSSACWSGLPGRRRVEGRHAGS
jgi:hypothetical protein